MSKTGRAALAAVVAAGVITAMAWYDTTVVLDAERRARSSFQFGLAGPAWTAGTLAIAGSVLLLGMLAWRSRSAALGFGYLIVGAFFALLPWINPPEPFVTVVSDLYTATVGPLEAVVIIGAGMAIAGVAVIARSLRERAGQPGLR